MEYTKLVQERNPEYTIEDVLIELNAALQISSNLPGAQKSADDQLVSFEDEGGGSSSESEGDLATVAQLNHHLNNVLCIVSEKFTSQGSLKVMFYLTNINMKYFLYLLLTKNHLVTESFIILVFEYKILIHCEITK